MSGLIITTIKNIYNKTSTILKPILKYTIMIEHSRRENIKRKSFINKFNRENKIRAYRNDEI